MMKTKTKKSLGAVLSVLTAVCLFLSLITFQMTFAADAAPEVMSVNVEDLSGEWADGTATGDADGNLVKEVGKGSAQHIGSIPVETGTAVSFRLDLKKGIEYRIALKNSGNGMLQDGDLIMLVSCWNTGDTILQLNRYNQQAYTFNRESNNENAKQTSAVQFNIDGGNNVFTFNLELLPNGNYKMSVETSFYGEAAYHYVEVDKNVVPGGSYLAFFAEARSDCSTETLTAGVKSVSGAPVVAPSSAEYADLEKDLSVSGNEFLGAYDVGKETPVTATLDLSAGKNYRLVLRSDGSETIKDGDLLVLVLCKNNETQIQINRFNQEACAFYREGEEAPAVTMWIDYAPSTQITFQIVDTDEGGRILFTANANGKPTLHYVDIPDANMRDGSYFAVFGEKTGETALAKVSNISVPAKDYTDIAFRNTNSIVPGETVALDAVKKDGSALENVEYSVKTQGDGFEVKIEDGKLTTTAQPSDAGKTFVITAKTAESEKDLTMTVVYPMSFTISGDFYIGDSKALQVSALGEVLDNKDVTYTVLEGADVVKIEDGNLIGMKEGTAVVKANAFGGTKMARVTVQSPLTVIFGDPKIMVGEETTVGFDLIGSAQLSGETEYKIVSGEEFAELKDGKLIGKASGTVLIEVVLKTEEYGDLTATAKINVVQDTYNALYMNSANVYQEVGIVTEMYDGKGMIFEFDLLDFYSSSHGGEIVFVMGADDNTVQGMFDGGALSEYSNASAVSFYIPDPEVLNYETCLRYWPNVGIYGERENQPEFVAYDAEGNVVEQPSGNDYDYIVPLADDWAINRTYRIEFNYDGSVRILSKEVGTEEFTLLAETKQGDSWYAENASQEEFESRYSGIIMRRQENQDVSAIIDNLTMTLPAQEEGGEEMVVGYYTQGDSEGLEYSLDGYPNGNYVSGAVNKLYVRADNSGMEVETGDTVNLSWYIPDGRELDVSFEIVGGSDFATLEDGVLTAMKEGTVKVIARAGDYESDALEIKIISGGGESDDGGAGLPTGAIIGIAAGAVVIVAAIAVTVFVLMKKKKKNG